MIIFSVLQHETFFFFLDCEVNEQLYVFRVFAKFPFLKVTLYKEPDARLYPRMCPNC